MGYNQSKYFEQKVDVGVNFGLSGFVAGLDGCFVVSDTFFKAIDSKKAEISFSKASVFVRITIFTILFKLVDVTSKATPLFPSLSNGAYPLCTSHLFSDKAGCISGAVETVTISFTNDVHARSKFSFEPDLPGIALYKVIKQ